MEKIWKFLFPCRHKETEEIVNSHAPWRGGVIEVKIICKKCNKLLETKRVLN